MCVTVATHIKHCSRRGNSFFFERQLYKTSKELEKHYKEIKEGFFNQHSQENALLHLLEHHRKDQETISSNKPERLGGDGSKNNIFRILQNLHHAALKTPSKTSLRREGSRMAKNQASHSKKDRISCQSKSHQRQILRKTAWATSHWNKTCWMSSNSTLHIGHKEESNKTHRAFLFWSYSDCYRQSLILLLSDDAIWFGDLIRSTNFITNFICVYYHIFILLCLVVAEENIANNATRFVFLKFHAMKLIKYS